MWLDEMRLKELDAVVSKAFSKLSKLQAENQDLRAQQAEREDPAKVRTRTGCCPAPHEIHGSLYPSELGTAGTDKSACAIIAWTRFHSRWCAMWRSCRRRSNS